MNESDSDSLESYVYIGAERLLMIAGYRMEIRIDVQYVGKQSGQCEGFTMLKCNHFGEKLTEGQREK